MIRPVKRDFEWTIEVKIIINNPQPPKVLPRHRTSRTEQCKDAHNYSAPTLGSMTKPPTSISDPAPPASVSRHPPILRPTTHCSLISCTKCLGKEDNCLLFVKYVAEFLWVQTALSKMCWESPSNLSICYKESICYIYVYYSIYYIV